MTIRIQQLHKYFKLFNSPYDRLKETFHPFRKKYHKKFSALKGVNLSIGKGETLGIIGRNGSGKSTLLQLICGILTPSSGNVIVDGRISALLELGAGFNPEFTGRENVFLNGSILGFSRNDMEACFDEIVEFSGIHDFIDQPVKTYSSGMYIRLAFAVAINVKPDILIVDEALSVGDTLFQAKCYAKFKEFQENGATILFVTHSLDLVIRYCNRAILLDKGALLHEGDPKEVVDAYNRLLVRSSAKKGTTKSNNEKENSGEISGESRYGIGKVFIDKPDICDLSGKSVRNLIQGEEYIFCYTVVFNEPVDKPIFAYTIKDVQGFDLTGTNTLYKEIDTGTAKKGDQFNLSFRQKIWLTGGGYLISFGCAGFEAGEYTVYERRYDVLDFQVFAQQSTVGFFDSDSHITFTRTSS
ncbi:MAG: ABC transporter ATP-binding protein [Bacteroidetes bacterium]|nr:ABC transporter ATP-binding protein [Bacteroidota bacterium]